MLSSASLLHVFQVNQAALKVGVKESDVGKINEAALHFALTVASFLVEDKVS